jgi:regulator of RNase E activity RraA
MSFLVPDACTLPTAARPLRLAEFDALFAGALDEVRQVDPTHARLRLSGPAGLAATVRDLSARETRCCSFFAFTVTAESAPDGDVVVLDVEVPAEHAGVLASLAQRASTVAGRAS